MKQNGWKIMAIVLMGMVGIFIILGVVPGLVVLVTTPHIVKVDTESQWISFWGNYLGALIGGVLGIAGAVFVLEKTLKDNKQERERREVLSFCDYFIKKSSECVQKCRSCIYGLAVYINKNKSDEYSKDTKIQLLEDFFEMYYSGKLTLYELQRNLEIRGTTMVYQTASFEKVQKECLKLIDVFNKIEKDIADIEESDEIFKLETRDIINELNGFMNTLDKYGKELFAKAVK